MIILHSIIISNLYRNRPDRIMLTMYTSISCLLPSFWDAAGRLPRKVVVVVELVLIVVVDEVICTGFRICLTMGTNPTKWPFNWENDFLNDGILWCLTFRQTLHWNERETIGHSWFPYKGDVAVGSLWFVAMVYLDIRCVVNNYSGWWNIFGQ
jgi:hypothetical protein